MSVEIIQAQNMPSLNVSQEHAQTFKDYTQKKLAPESRRSYSFGWKKFEGWMYEHGYLLGNDANHIAFLVGAFLSDMAKTGTLKYRSLVAYHAAIKSFVNDIFHIKLDHPEIKNAMQGIRNDLKQVPIKKEAVKAEHISSVTVSLKESGRLIDLRDRAILLIGFSGAFRRSELVGIDFEHISFDEEGISIRIPHSKTDQAGTGQHVEIPKKPNSVNCPVTALNEWLKVSGITEGGIFRSITKHGVISSGRLPNRMIAEILKKRTKGMFKNSEDIAGHSLRRGFVISSFEAGVDVVSILNQTRHASVNTLKEYSSDKKNYKTNALNSIAI